MRMAILAIVATLGAATLAGPANATALMDRPAANSSYQLAVDSAGCPAGWRWDPAHYNHWSVWQPGRCTRY